ncbi:cupin domain-containing protein [Nocardiopsis sp. RSe5-2]|uniref:Cupin domain-containing protein n=1 Tax=Nocardiopsis endophytica TaxID=3018445 RepID=A0ABT4U9B7_9ACTN|nr:cupin domain-containing protein [Nocardiopsis endophytica]MDA2813005.1 cupin domain-containing protein [Nocardiopsis endophytica]
MSGGEAVVGAPLAFTRAVLCEQGAEPVEDTPDRAVLRLPGGGPECELTAAAADRTRVRWDPAADGGAGEKIAALAAGAEQRRRRPVSAAAVPANRRRGGDVRTMLAPPAVGATSGFSGTARLAPGERITEHYHPFSEEFVHVVAGRVDVEMEEERVRVDAGEGLLIPREVRHRMVNDGDEEAAVVFFLSPLAPRPDLGHVDTEGPEGAAEPDGGRG